MTKEEIDAILDDLVTLWSGTYSERRQARLQLASTLQAERESEREACAKVADDGDCSGSGVCGHDACKASRTIGRLIRARGAK
jgi:hypothetical protein